MRHLPVKDYRIKKTAVKWEVHLSFYNSKKIGKRQYSSVFLLNWLVKSVIYEISDLLYAYQKWIPESAHNEVALDWPPIGWYTFLKKES